MPSRAYYEQLWQSLPEGRQPDHARLRERFLRERLAVVAARSRTGSDAACDRGERPLRALDLGCGEGRFADVLIEAGAHVLAVDVAAEPLRRAQARRPDLETLLIEPPLLPLEDSSFDVVWAGEVIEHVPDTAAWLSEVRRVLRSDGHLLLTTPDHGPLTMMAMALLPQRLDAHFDPRGDHLRFYTRRTLAALLADFGFAEVEVRAAGGMPGARAVLLACARRRRF
jgi:2-polyprenyl-3-methyl-5-hydroxy-6-metoxy-1,4-benzoquinol methylase